MEALVRETRRALLRGVFLAVGIGAAGIGQPVPDASAQTSATAWPEITREAKPWTRWWWMGSAVDRPNLTRELETLAAAGFGGVEVTAIYGARGWEDAYVPYLSDQWIDLLLHAANEARRLDMGIDMPPGSGWRTGGPEVPLEDANASLRITVDTVQGGTTWNPTLADRRIDGILAVSDGGRSIELPRQLAGGARRPPRGRAPAAAGGAPRPRPGRGRRRPAALARYLAAWTRSVATERA
jgi:hypothetical protein